MFLHVKTISFGKLSLNAKPACLRHHVLPIHRDGGRAWCSQGTVQDLDVQNGEMTRHKKEETTDK